MKKLLLLLILISGHSLAQQADTSMNARVQRIENNIEYLKQQLTNAHGQFRIGATSLLIGCASTAWAAISKQPDDTRQAFLVCGSVLELLGMGIMIDSHKFIGRAGMLEINYDSIKWNFAQRKN